MQAGAPMRRGHGPWAWAHMASEARAPPPVNHLRCFRAMMHRNQPRYTWMHHLCQHDSAADTTPVGQAIFTRNPQPKQPNQILGPSTWTQPVAPAPAPAPAPPPGPQACEAGGLAPKGRVQHPEPYIHHRAHDLPGTSLLPGCSSTAPPYRPLRDVPGAQQAQRCGHSAVVRSMRPGVPHAPPGASSACWCA
jgi:hypothetical protein